jgi:hypothetical protein
MGKQQKEKEARRDWERRAALMDKHGIHPPEDYVQARADNLIFAFAIAAEQFIAPLDQARTEGALREGTGRLLRHFEQVQGAVNPTVRFANEPKPLTIQCKKGCNYCCHVRVSVYAPEALVLAKTLKRILSPDDMQALLTRIKAFEAETATLSAIDQIMRASLCPLNVDALCIGYISRPVGCIGYHSFNLQKCKEDFTDPTAFTRVPMDVQRWQIREIHARALRLGMEAFGFDTTEFEFVPALRIALLDDEAGAKYVNGEKVFAEADKPEVRLSQDEDIKRMGGFFGEG